MAAVAGKTESRTARFRAMAGVTGQGKDQGAEGHAGLRLEEGKPPVGYVSAGRRQSRSLRQQSHPARFVAGAGNLWRVSTHKGSPMFRRRAPALSTVDPKGPPDDSRDSKASGGPS